MIRTGLGWDVHRLDAGRPLILGGVTIASEFGLEGHSDADILSHAITDALLGAAALGDIGMHFPGYRSPMERRRQPGFWRTPRGWFANAGYQIVNVDTTVILERPKLKDYRLPIRESLAQTLGLDWIGVSVKFKTAERVGPVGEGKSAEAQAIVTLSNEI